VWLTGPAESKGNLQVELRYACVAPTVHSVILVFIFVKDKFDPIEKSTRAILAPSLDFFSPTIYCIKTIVLSNWETAKRGNHDLDF
jgi:hypothetical protein